MNKNDKDEVNRISQQFLEQLNEEVPVEIEVYHANNKRIWQTSNDEDKNDICARKVKYLKTGNTRYFVKRLGCTFFDPGHISPIYKRQNWIMGPVSEQAFNLYLAFLGFREPSAKGRSYLKQRAERLV